MGRQRREPRRAVPRGPDGTFVTTITEEKIAQIVQLVQAGVTFQGAAGYAGVPQQTFYRWMLNGRRYPDEFPLEAKLIADLDEALGSFEATALMGIRRAAENNWQAWAWLLERKFPDRYSKKIVQDVSITATSDDPRIVALHAAGFEGDPALLSEDELETLITLMHKAIPVQAQLESGLPVIEQGRNGGAQAA